MYEATSLLLVKFGREYVYQDDVGGGGGQVVPRGRETLINSEIQILRSAEVVKGVVEAMGVDTLYPSLALEPTEGRPIESVAAARLLAEPAGARGPGRRRDPGEPAQRGPAGHRARREPAGGPVQGEAPRGLRRAAGDGLPRGAGCQVERRAQGGGGNAARVPGRSTRSSRSRTRTPCCCASAPSSRRRCARSRTRSWRRASAA